MFLKAAIPDSGQELARYREWIKPAFNAADFGRLYSDLFGHSIAHAPVAMPVLTASFSSP